MKPRIRSAWIASGLVHLLIVAGLWQFGESRTHRAVAEVPTVALTDERPIVMALTKEDDAKEITVTVPEPPKAAPPVEPPPVMTPVVPEVVNVVQNLQPAKFESQPAPSPVAPPPFANLPVPVSPIAPTRFAEGKVLHGLLPDGRRALYLLDRSASMGLVRETFEAARAAVFATACGTRPGGAFQALVYNSDVQTLLGGPRNAWEKMDSGVPARLRKSLAALEPEGRSRHDLALRAALAQEPDYILWTTDADDSELAALKPILRGSRKPVAVYLCRATAGRVEAPVEWK